MALPAADYHPVPVLKTERLILRAQKLSDFEPLVAMHQEPAFYHYLSAAPDTAEAVWIRMLRNVGHWTLQGYGFWAVEEKATGLFIGNIGFADFKRDIDPPSHGEPEIGWVLAPSAHGKGYASEAVQAALAWGDANFPAPRTICIIHPDNQASLKVAERFGYREYSRTTYKGEPIVQLDRLRPDPS